MKQFIYLTLFVFSAVSSTLFAEETKLKALLISIEKYEIAPLDFAVKDVSMLATVLMTRYGCEVKAYINSAESQSGDTPRSSIMREITAWCNSLKEGDTALLYIAGHGVKDPEGKIHLAMMDFDTKNFETAAIPISWIRECFEKGAASRKVIFLDSCFAGTSRSVDFDQASAEETSRSLSEAEAVAVVAGSQADELSWLWSDAKHSLFTFWLIEALKGHADRNDDRMITFDELTSYLQEHVPWAAQSALGKSQNPVVLNKQSGKEVIFPLRAVPLADLIDDIAEQIDLQMEIDRFPLVAISELTTGLENSFGKEYGALPKWVTDSLRRALSSRARLHRRAYKVVNENTTQSLFRDHGLNPDDIGTAKTANLKVDGEEVPLLVTGKLTFIGEMGISFRVQLINARERNELSQIGGTARLNGKEMAMAGISGHFSGPVSSPSNPQRFHSDPAVGILTEDELRESQRIQQERQKPHPMSDPGFAWKASIEVRPVGSGSAYRPRLLVFIGNDCYLPLSKGEEYQIRLDNASDQLVFARILVDGLSTLSQRRATTQNNGAFVTALADFEFEVAPRVSLEEARSFVRLPKVRYVPISGFIDAKGAADTVQRFRIVDADQSVAARKGYTDQIGLITIGIFRAEKVEKEGTMRNIGTGMGSKEAVTVRQYNGDFVAGEMIAAFNIRYLTPEMLDTIKKPNP